MHFTTSLSLLASLLPLTQACYRVHGYIQQNTNVPTQTATFLPFIFVTKNGTQVCNGHFSDEHSYSYQPNYIPGGIPANQPFGGPWSAYDCDRTVGGGSESLKVDVFGVSGQVLVREESVALWVGQERMAWKQPALAQGIAGQPDLKASIWTFDSGDVGC